MPPRTLPRTIPSSHLAPRILLWPSTARGPHFGGPQFTHWSAMAIRKFWSAVYKLVGPHSRSASPHFTTAPNIHLSLKFEQTICKLIIPLQIPYI